MLLALGGLLLIVAGSLLGILVYPFIEREAAPELAASPVWQGIQSMVPLSPGQAFVVSLLVILLGILLTIPWWWQRLRQENIWWEKRDEPLDPPPRAGV